MVEIVEVKTRKQKKLFATFPIKLYKDCPYYVPSIRNDDLDILDKKKNACLTESDCRCFLAYKDGKLVGRIAGIIHKNANKLFGTKKIRFSRFEAIDDLEVFKALLGAVENYGKEEGLEVIHGPWGFNDTDREGMLTYGFDRVSTYATNYSYPYFAENMRKLGWADESKWIEFEFEIPKKPFEKMDRLAEKLKKKYNLRDVAEEVSVSQIVKKYGNKFFETYNESYGHLDEFCAVSPETQQSILDSFGMIINARYFSLLVDENDEVAGAAVVFPSLRKPLIKHKGNVIPFGIIGLLHAVNKPKELEMAIIGVKKSYKNTGIHSIMMSKIIHNIIEDGIEQLESNPMLEHNYDIQANWKFTKTEIIKRRQTFVKNIEK